MVKKLFPLIIRRKRKFVTAPNGRFELAMSTTAAEKSYLHEKVGGKWSGGDGLRSNDAERAK